MEESWRPLLEARRDQLATQLRDLRRDVAAVIAAARDANLDDEHDPEGSTIAFERSQLQVLAGRAADELAEVDHAVARLARGAFGRCEACGAPIGVERLAALPTTRVCVGCAVGRRGSR